MRMRWSRLTPGVGECLWLALQWDVIFFVWNTVVSPWVTGTSVRFNCDVMSCKHISSGVGERPEEWLSSHPDMNWISLCSFTVAGLLLGLFWFCGILLHPVGTTTWNPTTSCLPAQSHHTKRHRGNANLTLCSYESYESVTVQRRGVHVEIQHVLQYTNWCTHGQHKSYSY